MRIPVRVALAAAVVLSLLAPRLDADCIAQTAASLDDVNNYTLTYSYYGAPLADRRYQKG
jgi:hypothetical protein